MVSVLLAFLSSGGSRMLASWMIDAKEVQVIHYASEYLRITGIGFLFLGMSSILSSILTSSGDTRSPFFQQLAVTLLNILLNYLLIFGNLGFPAMGVAGAAWASVISIAAGNGILILIMIRKKLVPDWIKIVFPDRQTLKKLIINGLPMVGDMFIWQTAMITYLKLIGLGGVSDLAVYGIVGTFFSMLFLSVSGFVMGTGTICSQNIGAGWFKAAYLNAIKAWKTALWVSVTASMVLISISWLVPSWFKLNGSAWASCFVCLVILGIRQVFATTNGIMAYVIRSGSDSLPVMMITLSAFIFAGLPLALLAGPVFQTGIVGIFIALSIEEAVKAILFVIRFRSRKWLVRSIGRPELVKPGFFEQTGKRFLQRSV
jgi:putative MATE family efflux protein